MLYEVITDEVVIDRKARRADSAQHRIAQIRTVVELVGIGGFKKQPPDVDHLHQQAIAEAVGEGFGIVRFASVSIPMDSYNFV